MFGYISISRQWQTLASKQVLGSLVAAQGLAGLRSLSIAEVLAIVMARIPPLRASHIELPW